MLSPAVWVQKCENPVRCAMSPPLDPKLRPLAEVVPPASAAVPVPQLVPVPSITATLSAAPAIMTISQT